MATRRWIGELEKWMRTNGLTKEEVAERASGSTQHVLALFHKREPNPTLKLYLDVVDAAGARIKGVSGNTPSALIARLRELRDREGISNVRLAQMSGVRRPQLSTLFNNPDPNPKLAMLDAIVTALGVEEDISMVACSSTYIEYEIAVGERKQSRVQATQEAVDSTRRRLAVVEAAPAADSGLLERTIANLRSKLSIAEKDLAGAKEQSRRHEETIERLKQDEIDREKRLADSDARWRRVLNETKQAAQDSDAQLRRVLNETKQAAQERELKQNKRIHALEARPQWTTLQVAGIGLGGAAVGAAAGLGLVALLEKIRARP